MTEYTLTPGTFTAQAVTIDLDSCGTMLTVADIPTEWVLTQDAGPVSIATPDGRFSLGVGALQCNRGTLIDSTRVSANECVYSRNRSTTVSVTANNRLEVVLTDTRADPQSAPGMTCRLQPN